MTNLTIRFQNLNKDEIAKIEQFEDTYPNHVSVSFKKYGFDGMAFYQIIVALASLDPQVQAAIIGGIAAVLTAIITRIPSETPTPDMKSPTVVIVLDGGHTKELKSLDELKSLLERVLPEGESDES